MIFLKLNFSLNLGIVLVSLVLASSLGLLVGKNILESIQKSKSIDESQTISSAPALNRQALSKALEIISANDQLKPKSVPEGAAKTKKVEIINTTEVGGAAQNVAALFSSMPGVKVDLKNGESDLDETTLFYKNEYSDLVTTWQKNLNDLDWNVGRIELKDNGDEYDVSIILVK